VIAAIDEAVDLAFSGAISGIVTNPIQKEALYGAGFRHQGHTDYLAHLSARHGKPVQEVMMLVAEDLRAIPITVHIPLKDVLKILNVSHHTLDPIRRAMGLSKWPFVDIVRGKFWNHEEVVALRAQMMPVADTDMQKILCRVATRSQEFWKAPSKRRESRKQTQQETECPVQRPHTPEPAEEEQQPCEVETMMEEEGSFWDDMRDLFGIANHGGDLSPDPRVEEHGLFP
jgi:hypothetical protein